jgi:uncharacterized damage-inducible protein DinB
VAAPSLDTLDDLLHHMEWADASIWRALLAHPPAVNDTRLRDLLLHLHGVQRAFLSVWTGQLLDAHPASATMELTSAYATVHSYYGDLRRALGAFDNATLERPVVMPGLEPYEEQMGRRFDAPTLAETVLQVVSHSTYHRGQVNARLRELGGEPPLVDYIAWIWFGRPAPSWDARYLGD